MDQPQQLFDLITLGMLWRDQAAEKTLVHSGGSVLHFGAGKTAYRLALSSIGVQQAMQKEAGYKDLLTPSAYMRAWEIYLSQIRAQHMRTKEASTSAPAPDHGVGRTVRAVPEENWEW